MMVDLPDGALIYKHGSTFYVYINTEKVYLKDKGYNENKRMCIGKLSEDDKRKMIPNKNYNKLFADQYLPEAPERSDTLQAGLYVVLSKAMHEMSLDTLLDSAYGEDSFLMQDIVQYMIGCESNAMQYFPDYAYESVIHSERIHDDNEICEMFKKQSSQQHDYFLKNWNALHTDVRGVYISYDSTNMNTCARGVELAEYGAAKDDPDIPDVNFSLAYDQDNGTPYFYELYHGSIIDNTQCQFMVERAQQYGYHDVGFILDRGYFSSGNIKFFDKHHYDFIIMAKGNARFVQEAVDGVSERLRLTPFEDYLDEHEVYGKTIRGCLYPGDQKTRYIHIYYDEKKAAAEREAFLSRLHKMDEELDKRLEKKLTRKQDIKSYEKYYSLKFDDNGYFMAHKRKKQTVQKAMSRLGFFVLITSEKMSASEALDKYRHRDSIEKLFRTDKSYLGGKAFRVYTDISLESKTMETFIAIILRNDMFNRLKPLYQKDRKNFTVPEAIHQLNKLTITRNPDGKYYQKYAVTKRQKEILSVYGISEQSYASEIKKICQRIR